MTSGTLGDHGMAVLSLREQLQLKDGPVSDTAPVHRLVQSIRPLGAGVRMMRDPTRGGAASVLHEIVAGQKAGILLEEAALPFSAPARAVAEMLGFDLLHVASEGRLLAVCDPVVAQDIITVWQGYTEGQGAAVIGRVTGDAGKVVLRTFSGGKRLVDMPEGELLPRIC